MTTKSKEVSLVLIPSDIGLAPEVSNSISAKFVPFAETAKKIQERCTTITVASDARAARIELKTLRVSAEKLHKTLKEDSLKTGRAIDSCKNAIIELCRPLEEMMEGVEKAEERALAEKKRLIVEKRSSEVVAAGGNPAIYTLDAMADFDFEVLLDGLKVQQQARLDAQKRLEEARAQALAEEKAEQEKVRLENEKLKAEAVERDRLAKIESDRVLKEKAELEAKAEKERKVLQKKLHDEKAESARKQKEADEKLKAEQEKAKAIQQEADRKEKAIKAEKDRLELVEKTRIEDEEKAEREKAKAPDKQKILNIATYLIEMDLGTLNTNEGRELQSEIKARIATLSNWIKQEAKNL